MTEIDTARAMLPNLPEEAFDLWVRPCVSKNGWPYDSIHHPGDHYWQGYFLGLPLNEVAELSWDLIQWKFDLASFEEETQDFLHKMMLLHVTKVDPRILGVAVPMDSESRYHSAKSFIEEKQAIPGSVILLRTPNGLKIFDGWHRLAAIHALKEMGGSSIEVPAWIATPDET